jgi:predicted ATPase
VSLGDARSVHIQQFGLLKDQRIDLEPFMVFIGRNDSGKTTALRALAAALEERPRGRTGGWVPTQALVEEIGEDVLRRARREDPAEAVPAEFLVYGRDPNGTTVRLQSPGDNSRPPVPETLHDRLSAPVGGVVWLDLGDLGRPEDQVREFLHLVRGALAAEAEEAGDRNLKIAATDEREPDWPSDTLGEDAPHDGLFDIGDEGRAVSVRPWVRYALDELGRAAYLLLPDFARQYYAAVATDVITNPPFAPWSYSVTLLAPGRRPYSMDELASGVRAWVNLAIREAKRELLGRPVHLTTDSFLFDDPDERAHRRLLYLVDEPERHLHPEAQRLAARWLLERSRDPGVGVAVATHSPAFLDLPRGAISLYLCRRDPDGEGATIEPWGGERLAATYDAAEESGLLMSDVFLAGTVPLIVEGKFDREYVRTVWRILFGFNPEADGIRMVVAGGINEAGKIVEDVLDRAYRPDRAIYFLTDSPDLDVPEGHANAQRLQKDFNVVVLAHHRFDIWALIREDIVMGLPRLDPPATKQKMGELRFGAEGGPAPLDWKKVEQVRKLRLRRGERLPSKDVLQWKGHVAYDQFRLALTRLEKMAVNDPSLIDDRVREILGEIRADALRRTP